MIIATARPGQTLDKIQAVIDEELDKLRAAPPEPREVQRAINQYEANFFRGMERVGGFGGKANQLNSYYQSAGTPDYFQRDLDRYRALTPADIKAAVEKYLPKDRRVELSVVPGEKK
jgi:zinc protease